MRKHQIEEQMTEFNSTDDIYFNSLSTRIPQIFSFIDPQDYTIKFINKVEEGYEKAAVIGQSIFNYILPEHKELYLNTIEEVKKTGETKKIDVGFLSYQTPKGITWCQTSISSVVDDAKVLRSILVLSEDITESKLLEIENNNQSERIKAIINNTIDIICSIDLDYNLIEFNATLAKIIKTGFNVDVKRGMAILDYMHPDKHKRQKEIYAHVLAGETKYDIDQYTLTTGEEIYIESSYHPIFNVEEQITGISIFSKNITERIKSEQKIKIALKEKEVLLAEIHHRIKNNLAMVSSLLQLKELNIQNEEAKEALNSSRKRIKTTALIHELLYRNESFHDISFKDFVAELFDLLKTNDSILLEYTGDDVSFNLTTALPLGLMLNELMLNSFKYTYNDDQSGKTEIIVSKEKEALTINYCDCRGSFPTEIDFINSQTTGLTLIHTFAEQLNGSIELIQNSPPHYLIQISLS
jgi:PAS domain S-box-containing protein